MHFLEESYKLMQKFFVNFECALYMKSLSMPLMD